jgi:hypothetical protein
MTITFKKQEITTAQLITMVRELAELSANGYGSLYRTITLTDEENDMSCDIKLRVSDHFPNPARVDERTLSFSLADAPVYVGNYRHGYKFLDESFDLMDTYESLEYVIENEIEWIFADCAC